ncbi:hypothetical protein ACIREE_06170 [Streptomyces sp. NPDC102467]|uniref:hypothetical protein n=1 Tax=Streptomyces sp. NPDC102467 TaxID=3366179 RepID=UPI00380B4BB9
MLGVAGRDESGGVGGGEAVAALAAAVGGLVPGGQLRAELGVLGALPPWLRVDPVSAAGEAAYPLVDPGCVNLDTAMRMVAVLHERNAR